MFNTGQIAEMILWIPPILLALTIHELAHGYVANMLGDPTAKNAGRLTLNPLAHLDPLGTVMLIFAHFGWAKPVPVNPYNLGNPRRDMILVSLAGPLSNLMLALISGLLARFYITMGGGSQVIFNIILFSMRINVVLMVFNLIPIPPLDGSKILFGLMDVSPQTEYNLSKYGPMMLLGIILLGLFTPISIFGMIISPFMKFFSNIFFRGL